MNVRCVLSSALLLLISFTGPTHAGGRDLHPDREPPRDTARSRAQDAQKLKLLAKLRQETAPAGPEKAPRLTPLELPLFGGRPQP